MLESEVERRTAELAAANEALIEADRRKDNFLANISHELRTPLVTVLGYTEILLSERLGPLNARQRECLSVSRSSGKRLKAFIEELLDFSRFELTREAMRRVPLDLEEAILQSVTQLQPRFTERKLAVDVQVARRTPRVYGDKDRLLQVFSNLLTNAERYSPDGAQIEVRVRGVQRGAAVQVTVTDHGRGIAREHLEKIFERLYQVGDATDVRLEGRGLGLGLHIVKSIVEAHGGSIEVQSRVGHGTRFTFRLPAVPRDAAAAQAV
jgi:signal transduction histidine kinase